MFQHENMIYVFYGSLAILAWKCGTQLLKEAIYKPINQDEEDKKKAAKTKISKYHKVMY